MNDFVVEPWTVERWLRGSPPVWLVHVGGAEGFRAAHLPGAIHFADPAQAAAVLRADDRIVVYGEVVGCSAAAELAAHLRRVGFADVRQLAVGLPGWRAAGGRVEGAGP